MTELTAVLNVGKLIALNELLDKIRLYELNPAAFRLKMKNKKRFAEQQVFNFLCSSGSHFAADCKLGPGNLVAFI